ncbi:hypothetical protein PHISP_05766 [Aspergillus sp. HF37]|nr:hypothetical protein PHISP_05766 [Aspergillus sp. HF37]
MDTSHLSRPAVSCQCARCFSSVAALENEWAKLSDSRAIAPGWMSVDLFRISVSSEQKRIPESSDWSLLRGRITQEIRCRLCQQKLGALCALDNGTNILWRLSKVSFREIISMKTVPPFFKEEALERIATQESSVNDSTRDTGAITPGALAQSATEDQNPNAHPMNTLHESMAELKHDFTSLRIKLDDPSQLPAETGDSNGMVSTLLLQTELIGKLRREIETLRQENKSIKQGTQYTGDRTETQPASSSTFETHAPDPKSSEFLQGGRKRPWGDAFPSRHTQSIADSFETGDGDFDGQPVGDPQPRSIDIESEGRNEHPTTTDGAANANSSSGPPKSPIEQDKQPHHPPHPETTLDEPYQRKPSNQQQNQTVAKRPRLSEPTGMPRAKGATVKRPGPGRPRKSDTAPKQTSLAEQTVNMGAEQLPTPNSTSPVRNTGRKRGRPPGKPHGMRGRPRAQRKASPARSRSRHSVGRDDDPDYTPTMDQSRTVNGSEERTSKESPMDGISVQTGSEKENPAPATKGPQKCADDDDQVAAKKQRELSVRREKEVRIAMAQEEAREFEGV